MKRAVILHGTSSSPQGNWFPWLKAALEERGYKVWVPQLPDAGQPDARKYTSYLMEAPWDFQDNLIIGHSSGSVEVLHLLDNLPDHVQLKAAVLVSTFTDEILASPQWAVLKGIFAEPLDMAGIKSKAKKFIAVHGDDDPYCKPAWAQTIAKQLDAEYIEVPGGQHFSTSIDPGFTTFPQLIKILEERDLV